MISLTYRINGIRMKTRGTNESLVIKEEKHGFRFTVRVTALEDLVLESAVRTGKKTFEKDDLLMMNGYQSWTETRQFAYGEHLNDLSRRPKGIVERWHFREYGSQAFMKMKKDENTGFDYAQFSGKKPLFIGNYNYKNAYLIIKADRGRNQLILESDVCGRKLEAGESFTVFDYIADRDGKIYFNHFRPKTERKLVGYTSWYHHYQDINEEKLLSVLDTLDERFDLFQIDDGFEPFVGDWLETDKEKFPSGLKPIVDKIHADGRKAGIWIAPFVAEEKSELAKAHPDWIAHDEKDSKLYSGSNWSSHSPLDLNNPEVVSYIRKVLRYYSDLGFDFFKLDFLYASNLKLLKGRTRSETAEFAYRILRDELKGKIILGCGATLSNAFERFEYCRVGPDVSLQFDDKPFMRLFHPERISTKVTLHNTIFRKDLNGHMFLNDPDVFILRDDNVSMSLEQRAALTRINAVFGSLLMTSDQVGDYDTEKNQILDEALDLFYNARPVSAEREGKIVKIIFDKRGKKYSFDYNTDKGIILNWPLLKGGCTE